MARHSRNGFLTCAGYRLAEERSAQQSSLEGLAPRGEDGYVDSRVSVSALVEGEDDFMYDPLHIELNEYFVDPSEVVSNDQKKGGS